MKHQAGGGAAPHPEEDVPLPDELYYVPDHQEVVGELGVPDDLHLVLEAVLGLLGRVRIAFFEPRFADPVQVLVGVHPAGGLVFREVGLPELERYVAYPGDDAGVFHSLRRQLGRQPAEELLHLLGALQVVGVVLHPEPLRVLDVGVGLDADVDVLQAGLGLVHVVGIVGDDQRNAQVLPYLQQPSVYLF